MRRQPSDLHVAAHGLPLGSHRASRLCPCRPVECVELLGGTLGRIVYVHRDHEPVPDPAPPACSCPACVAFDAASAEDRAGQTRGTADRLALARERRNRAHWLGRRDPDAPDGAA